MHRDASAAAGSSIKEEENVETKARQKDGSIIIVLATDVSLALVEHVWR